MRKQKVYLLTEQELERFDHLLTALAQAYWSLVTKRSIKLPVIENTPLNQTITTKEADFYQLHLDLNDEIDRSTKY